MHIVFVHRGVFPERIGGTYSYIFELGRHLAARGHTVRVIASTREQEAPAPYLHEGMWIHKYAFLRFNPVASTVQHLVKVKRVFERIHAERPVDVLSIHDAQLGWLLARTRTGRSVCQLPTFHAPGFLEFRLKMKWQSGDEPSRARRMALRIVHEPMESSQKMLESGVLQCADGIHMLSRYSRSHIENHFDNVDINKVEIIPGGVDPTRFRPAEDRGAVRRDLGIDPEVIQILTVRNLSPRMGLENLVTALRLVRESGVADGRSLHLTICGDGVLRDSLVELVRSFDLDALVTFAGRVTDDDLVRHYQAADLFVLPTAAMEGFGISTVEALSVGLPVIGTPAGATPEILARIDQRLVTKDITAEAIADGIQDWLSWGSEERTKSRYRDEVLARYDWERVAERMEAWYSERAARFAAV